MNAQDVEYLLRQGFASAPRPSPNEVVSRACCECFRVRDDLSPYTWEEVPANVFEYHWDSFPLLTPDAFRYYLPGYLKHALGYPGSEVSRWIIEKLNDLVGADDFWSARYKLLSDPQRQAVRAFLQFAYVAPEFSPLRADIFDALVCWGIPPRDLDGVSTANQ